MKEPYIHTFMFAGRELSFEVGALAPRADASVLVRYGDTVVLVTITTKPAAPDAEYFPLRVDYEERLYAGGIIKGSRFMKREGRPTDEAILGCRLIDRSLRPLFPSDFSDEVHITATVLSVDGENDPQLLSLIGSIACLEISAVPWEGPLGVVHVGLNEDGSFQINPKTPDFLHSSLKLLVTASSDRVVMIEAEANEVSEEVVTAALEYSLEGVRPLLEAVSALKSAVGKQKVAYTPRGIDHAVVDAIRPIASEKITQWLSSSYEDDRAFQAISQEIFEQFQETYTLGQISRALEHLRKKEVRKNILEQGRRVDGRSLTDIRSLDMSVKVLPRTHGSALFNRGQTQVLSLTTLGPVSLEQLMEGMFGEETKRYMHHYNDPAFSTGEVGGRPGPGRRAIGHGALAEKALLPVLPDKLSFPYAIRVVSEALSQNGSSSMGSTCGSSLSLMDAGVPLSAHVGGISVGLVEDENGKFALLTDIRGLEDFTGDMDFKIAGTRVGVTAIQLDVKNKGLTREIFTAAIEQSTRARAKILDLMYETLPEPRKDVSIFAPKVAAIQIDVEKIGAIIGTGGKIIKQLMQETGTQIDVADDGLVSVSGPEKVGVDRAITLIRSIVTEPEVGATYKGFVSRIMDFGAFVEIAPNKEGLVHISNISHERVERVADVLQVGDPVTVKLMEIDDMGRLNLSMKALLPEPERGSGNFDGPRDDHDSRQRRSW